MKDRTKLVIAIWISSIKNPIQTKELQTKPLEQSNSSKAPVNAEFEALLDLLFESLKHPL